MSNYVQPHEVTSPNRRWQLISVVFDPEKPGDCPVALGRWDGDVVLAIRWNGSDKQPIGNPQSRGLATWFVLPKRYYDAIIATLSPDMQSLTRNFIPRSAQ